MRIKKGVWLFTVFMLSMSMMLTVTVCMCAGETFQVPDGAENTEEVTVQDMDMDMDMADGRPPWQAYLEDRLLPMLGAVVSGAATFYLLFLPVIKKIQTASAAARRSADGFDKAAGGIRNVSDETQTVARTLAGLKETLEEATAAVVASEEKSRETVELLLSVVSLAFSHEEELVKNGTAREIVKVVENYVGKKEKA